MKIKLVERMNPADRSQPAKWYANAVNAGKKDLKSIAAGIAGRSSLTRGDIENVLSNFVDELPELLKDGFSVQLGEFGTLRLSLSSEGAEKPEKFNTSNISGKVIFTPGAAVKKELSDIAYEQD
jgi:predicted histone-like DNA-binding protein